MIDCVFCKIASGEISSARIWEDEKHVAFLDLNPIRRGQTLVVPKDHLDSYVFKLTDEQLAALTIAAKKVGLLLDKTLDSERTCLVVEGMGVRHAHVKLYPLKLHESEGGVVHVGPRADTAELEELAQLIRKGGSN